MVREEGRNRRPLFQARSFLRLHSSLNTSGGLRSASISLFLPPPLFHTGINAIRGVGLGIEY